MSDPVVTPFAQEPGVSDAAGGDVEETAESAPRQRQTELCKAPSVLNHHVKRFDRVLDYIEQNLAGDLSLETLGQCAAISPFHFHRLFQAWAGETLSRFVRRRRLESAAGRLRYCPEEKITAISLNCGFSSPEAFARAFREHFGITPSQWRNGGWMNWRPAGMGRSPASSAPASVKVTRLEPAQYLFMRARGAYSQSSTLLWDRFLPWVRSMGLGDQPLLLIGMDDPSITDPALCRMDACVQLPPGWIAPDMRLARHNWPSRWVATLEYDGAADAIGSGWDILLNEWLPHAPFDMAEGHFFQWHDPLDGPPDSRWVKCKLCMPVKPRAC